MRFLCSLFAALLLTSPALPARTPPPAPVAVQEDGPYVLWEGPEARVLHFRQGKAEETALPASHLLSLPGLPPLRLDPAPPAPAQAIFPLPAKLAALSDIHGNFGTMAALLQGQGVIDRNLRWSFGKGHLVMVGDLLDRGAQATEVAWFLRSLEQQAKAAGGMVHVLLGNHETMVMGGDLRYTHPKYLALPMHVPTLFGPGSELGRWLRSLPVMVRLGEVLFVHGGVSPEFAAAHGDLLAVNAEARAELAGRRGPVLGNGGPLWYRGLIPGYGVTPSEEEVGTILRTYGARTLVVGHTTLDRVTAFHGGRVFCVDAGLKDGQPGELWLQLDGKRFRGLANGTRQPLD